MNTHPIIHNRYIGLSITIFALISGGCISNEVNYSPPSEGNEIINNIVVEMPFEEAWKKLVTGLSDKFFVINNIERESGFINLSYSGDPELYVDGGEIYYMVSNLAGKREYRFPASRSHVLYETSESGILYHQERSLHLEGRLNINVTPLSDKSTRITVNTRYILTQTNKGYQVWGTPLQPLIQTLSFNTSGSVKNSGDTTYKSNGKLEAEVLNILKE